MRPCAAPDACGLGYGQCSGPLPKRRVHVLGTVFFDLVYSGLPAPPRPGTEVQAQHLGISPGGVANIAVALARLGLDVGLSAVFAEDAFGQYLWSALAYEGIDLRYSVQSRDWTTPVTTSIAYERERSLITYEAPPPVDIAAVVPDGYRADAFVVSLANASAQVLDDLHRFAPSSSPTSAGTSASSTRPGWRTSWPESTCSCPMPQKLEQVPLQLTSSKRPLSWRRAPASSSSRMGVPGHFAIDPVTRAGLRVPALPVEARDTTGAGDVFDAGFIYSSLAGWPLDQSMRFANLCAAESVKHEGGSLAAPCWRDLGAFWDKLDDTEARRAYAFLPPLLIECPARQVCTRACPTMSSPPLASAASRCELSGDAMALTRRLFAPGHHALRALR